ITNEPRQMLMYADNLLDPTKGPEHYYTFDITNSVSAGIINIDVEMVDESFNYQQLNWSERSLDAQDPSLAIYSPSSSSDGSKYLAKETISISAGATDDVQIDLMQYKFTYNFGTGFAEVTSWQNPDNLQDVNQDGSAFIFSQDFSAGNFDNGRHMLTVRAVDSAGNEVIDQVIFTVDYCYNNIDGTTNCQYVQSLEPPPEPIIVEPSFSDPPYAFVWVTSGIAFISIILMLFVIRAGMKSPKKKSDEEYDDDDWMSEFIGTTQNVDMDALTNTADPASTEQSKEVPDIEEEEDDPFSVNVVQRKARRTKSKSKPEPEEEEEEEPFFGLDDEDFEEEEEEVEEKPKPRRKVGRRTAPKNAPKRRPTRRKKSED
ncbi:MAG: hypothetical protein VYC12_07010, partial [Candidatus Thermoplasmatota archaeon]|nr:hypothetical protein [Candidatus Thermoplasmatota archaeon]